MTTYKYWVVIHKGDAVIATHLFDTLEQAKAYYEGYERKIKKIAI